jgi:hypothetical protein
MATSSKGLAQNSMILISRKEKVQPGQKAHGTVVVVQRMA